MKVASRIRTAWQVISPATLVVLVAGELAILAWPIPNTTALATLDGSWQIALHMAEALHLRYGVEILFTYGPLGFLGFPHPYVGLTSGFALVVAIAIYVGLVATMLVEAKRILPLWAAAVVTLFVARIFVALPPFEASEALLFLWCVETLADRMPWSPTTLAMMGGALAGAALLGKINIGIVSVAVGAVTIAFVGRPWWRPLVVYLAAAVASASAFWLATGQHFGDLGAYMSGAYQIIAGYNDSMGGDVQAKRMWVFPALAGVVVLLAWAAWRTSAEWPRRRRLGLAVLGLVVGFAMWKLAVVREHTIYVFATSLVLLFALAPRVQARAWLASVLAVGIIFGASSATQPSTYFDIRGSIESIVHEVKDVVVPGQAAQRTQSQLRASLRLEPAALAVLGTSTVHIDPDLTDVALAYPQIHWQPLPIFQAFSAYTSDLDRRNADLLRSPNRPERILRSVTVVRPNDLLQLWMGRPARPGELLLFTVDGRFRWFEAPETTLETFCRYSQTVASDRWQVLTETGGSCGPAEPLAMVTARSGEAVQVPFERRPARFVIVRIGGLQPSLFGRIGAALGKPPDWYVKVDETRYRLMPDTAGDGLLLAVPPSADGTGPFAFGPAIVSLTITKGLDGRDTTVPLTFEFMSVPLR